MKYYLDGYNILFRNFSAQEDHLKLEPARNRFIEEISIAAQCLNLTIILVFDGKTVPFTFTRHHFASIEIIYTSKELSADAFFVSMLQYKRKKQLYTIVSNDRLLQQHCRQLGANIQKVDDFLVWLHHKVARKQRQQTATMIPTLALHANKLSQYYLQVFEAQLQKESTCSYPLQNIAQKPLAIKAADKAPLSNEEQRWLYLFEKNRSKTDESTDLG